jgi:hypothetical protein
MPVSWKRSIRSGTAEPCVVASPITKRSCSPPIVIVSPLVSQRDSPRSRSPFR